ncbi:MAG: UDP-N-acetylmuramoyl-L-alanyl-D-glutamate--2,6-diaminopimelate ligase, partial [Planctomycetota bacterium]|nr:UDP-N-acetylmuramoyl-L-alanyl-D-glutamate--2,6-diaminopimelate ligase [Planctomycetota bacterium]
MADPVGLPFDGDDPWIHAIEIDSRRVEPGSLFCALPGGHVDGADFIAEALDAGAHAILTDRPPPIDLPQGCSWIRVNDPRRFAALLAREFYGRPDAALKTIGVTGTNGKTSVTVLLEKIAEAAGERFGRLGTIGVHFHDVSEPLVHTTPEAVEFYRWLAAMRDAGMTGAAIEVSSHALAQSRVAGATFDAAVFLNLSRDHLDFHGSERAYFDAKAILFESLSSDAFAILPAGDPHGERLAARTAAHVLRFGSDSTGDVAIEAGRASLAGTSGTLRHAEVRVDVSSPVVGPFQLQNFAAAGACAVALGWPLEAVARGLAAVEGVPGRMEPIAMGQPFGVLVDYAHTDEALKQSLLAARGLAEGRLHVVFGCGGERDAGKRPRMGHVAATYADEIWLTHDNPRGEDPESILDQIETGIRAVGLDASRVHRVPDRALAIETAIEAAQADDLVLIAGKGHETVQVFADGP